MKTAGTFRAFVIPCLLPFAAWTAESPGAIPGFSVTSRGTGWRASCDFRPGGLAKPEPALTLAFPDHAPSRPGDFLQAGRRVPLPAARTYALTFTWADTFTGPTHGYHVAQVLVAGRVIWENDVAGGDLRFHPVQVDVTPVCRGKRTVQVTVRVKDRKAVTNFPVRVSWTRLAVHADDQVISLMPRLKPPVYHRLPPDLPLPALPPLPADWLRSAVILQPWGRTEHAALAEPGDQPTRLRDEFGFNALIVLPPRAHNAITAPEEHLTDEQFTAAVAAYRRAGYRLILYSALMHCGHDPAWQTGRLEREHPDWSQRDAAGNPLTLYGHEWLCPSTPALDYTLNYTLGLVERYHPDAVMLDNNEFLKAAAGPTCYCTGCQQRFRRYVRERFGEAGTKELFGMEPNKVKIPADPGLLFNLWIHWRNRVWAEATETFRRRLRETAPGTALFANTQYLHSGWLLATDLQYEHEDMLLAESRGLTGVGMADKMRLGRALAGDRPVWNYVGTFEENDLSRLRPPEELLPLVAATLASGANPWIVYYGFQRPGRNRASQTLLSRLLRWRAAHRDLFEGLRPAAPVAALVSPLSRNYQETPLIPACLDALRNRGIPLTLVSERRLTPSRLAGVHVLILTGVPCLSDSTAKRIAAWVRTGGTLVADLGVGWYDEIGQLRPESVLFAALRIAPPDGAVRRRPQTVGRGAVLLAPWDSTSATALLTAHRWAEVTAPGPPDVQPYSSHDGQRLVIHLVNYHGQSTGRVELTLPLSNKVKVDDVRLLSPVRETETPHWSVGRTRLTVTLPDVPLYAVLVVAMHE